MKIPFLSKIKIFWFHSAAKILGFHLNYVEYWNERYNAGFTSGKGSYADLAMFKADTINNFVKKNLIETVIEFGCGDGNQLKLMQYNKYLGLDVAYSAIEKCRDIFINDTSKSFILYNPKVFVNKGFFRADMVICLDVLYHIIPEDDYLKTLDDIFSCSANYVILYTDIDEYEKTPYKEGSHVFHRNTLKYLKNYPDFSLVDILQNKFPDISWASFIILKRIS
jgi:hypothetical protein